MTPLPRWIASLTLAPLAVVTLQGLPLEALGFTDANAELKEVAADRAARAPAVAKAVLPAPAPAQVPVRTAWVPASPKQLDGFKPVLPAGERPPASDRRLAKADAR